MKSICIFRLDRGLINEIRLIKSRDIFLCFITLGFEFEYYFKEENIGVS